MEQDTRKTDNFFFNLKSVYFQLSMGFFKNLRIIEVFIKSRNLWCYQGIFLIESVHQVLLKLSTNLVVPEFISEKKKKKGKKRKAISD